jgi:hypothetical protein
MPGVCSQTGQDALGLRLGIWGNDITLGSRNPAGGPEAEQVKPKHPTFIALAVDHSHPLRGRSSGRLVVAGVSIPTASLRASDHPAGLVELALMRTLTESTAYLSMPDRLESR